MHRSSGLRPATNLGMQAKLVPHSGDFARNSAESGRPNSPQISPGRYRRIWARSRTLFGRACSKISRLGSSFRRPRAKIRVTSTQELTQGSSHLAVSPGFGGLATISLERPLTSIAWAASCARQAMSRLRIKHRKGPYILQRMSLAWRTLPHKKLVKAANAVAKLDLGGHLWAKPLKLALAKTLPQLSGKHFSNLKAITVMELLDEPDAMRSYLEHAEQWRSHVRRASEGPARGKSIEGWPHVLDKWGQNSEGVKSRYVDGLGPTVPGFARAAEIRGP